MPSGREWGGRGWGPGAGASSGTLGHPGHRTSGTLSAAFRAGRAGRPLPGSARAVRATSGGAMAGFPGSSGTSGGGGRGASVRVCVREPEGDSPRGLGTPGERRCRGRGPRGASGWAEGPKQPGAGEGRCGGVGRVAGAEGSGGARVRPARPATPSVSPAGTFLCGWSATPGPRRRPL